MLLAIETSCDETASAVLNESGEVLSNIILSQQDIHSKYGGIVPEIASRRHLECIVPVVQSALEGARVNLKDISLIALTVEPGLIGALLIGATFAKGLAHATGAKIIPVNHLEGHLFSPFINSPPVFPFIGLIVSGGHTSLYLVRGPGNYELLGRTRDDAAGEAIDKVGRLFGIPYPAGPEVDRRTRNIKGSNLNFPIPMKDDESFDFSFSGLKTSVLNKIKRGLLENYPEDEILFSFQEAVIQSLLLKTSRCQKKFGVKRVVVSGGVAANSRLRQVFGEWGGENGVEVIFPPKELCTDNAVMIGMAGLMKWREGKYLDEVKVSSRSTML